jgi:integrase
MGTGSLISGKIVANDHPPRFHRISAEIETLLKRRPAAGPLFPYLCTVRANDRATEFHQRCVGLKIVGVSLHSYRYAWAERALKCGFPERFAQQALGHNSKAVHRIRLTLHRAQNACYARWEACYRDLLIKNGFIMRLSLHRQ